MQSDSRGDTLRRITKAALGGLAGCALVLGGTQVASGALTNILKIQAFAEDLQMSTEGPLDSARAKITIVEGTDSTTFSIRATGLGSSAQNQILGSHLHVGECIEGSGTSASDHYNSQIAAGVPKAEAVISRDTEVWFDLVADEEGMAHAVTTVQFVPVDSELTDPSGTPGVMSIVVHVQSTDPVTGLAGPRQACFPVLVPQWAD
jgi:Cu/Zn superoxide dismutase